MKPADQALRMSATGGSLDDIKYLIQQQGANANASGALLKAISTRQPHSSFPIAQFLLEEGGADPNLADPDLGFTPLYIASKKGDVALVELLLAHGANVDSAVNVAGTTPLMAACNNRHAAVVRCLLEHGANPFLARRTDGLTPLLMAVSPSEGSRYLNIGQSEAVVGLLLEQVMVQGGTEAVVSLINKRGYCGSNALHFACQMGNSGLVQTLLSCHEGDDNNAAAPLLEALSARNRPGYTPLFIACIYHNLPAVEAILQYCNNNNNQTPRCPFVDTMDRKGRPPLMVVTMSKNQKTRLVELLLEYGADPFAALPHVAISVPERGATPVHYAAKCHDLTTLELLLRHCSEPSILHDKVNAVMGGLYTPLSLATLSRSGGITTAKILLNHGANPFLGKTHDGQSPLERACHNENLEMVRLLLEAGVPWLLQQEPCESSSKSRPISMLQSSSPPPQHTVASGRQA